MVKNLNHSINSTKTYSSITVVMPCLNEELNIREAIKRTLSAFDFYNLDAELIVVNDGSQDNSEKIIKKEIELDNRIKLLSHKKNLGIGKSFFEGVKSSSKKFITIIPGDNENNPKEILSYMSIAHSVDMIIPFIYNSEIRSLSRRIISSLYRFIVNISFGTNLNYTNGTVIYRCTILKNFTTYSSGFFYQAEILIRLIRNGYLYAEIPQFLDSRNAGKSKAMSLKSLVDVTFSYFRLFILIHILRVVGKTDLSISESSATYIRKKNNQMEQ